MVENNDCKLQNINQNTQQIKEFIEFCKKQKFDDFELKIIELLIKKTKQKDLALYDSKTIKQFNISVEEIANFCNTSIYEIENVATKIGANFMTKTYVKNGIFHNFCVYFIYKNGFEIGLNPFFLDYLFIIKKEFENFNLYYILKMKNYTSILLYKALREHGDLGYVEFLIEELKQKLGLEEKYTQYGPLKLRVIEVAINNINKHTELNLSLTELKTRQKITKLKLIWKYKETQEIQAKKLFAKFAKTSRKDLEIKTSRDVNLYNSVINAAFYQFVKTHILNYEPNSIVQLKMAVNKDIL